ncbi:hypothetical protein [Curtobacterium sp. RRHDQ10]|uniref:hypothetical protein n=1 Tax=Curtobacterium phyllosphaerae TaxID=3413379 RepID=UPI003BF1F56E
MNDPQSAEGPEPRRLAQRLALLLDHVEAVRGTPYTFAEVNTFLEERGIPLSRARWGYMLSGDSWRIRDVDVLDGLAELFRVDVAYLRGDDDLPASIAAEMHLVRSLRRARVQHFAARNLGDTDPAAYEAIAQYLDQQAAGRD